MDYVLKKSTRAKNLRITVGRDGSITVTVPHRISEGRAHLFFEQNKLWVERSLAKVQAHPVPALLLPKGTAKEYKKLKEQALTLTEAKLSHFNKHYGFSWNKVFIKNLKSRWGSCSKQRNLNFSYRIAHLPDELADYLVVHELCHLGEFNHSKNFWRLVEKTLPNYLELRAQLRRM